MLIVITPADTFDLTTIEAVKAEISTDNDELLGTMITQASQAIANHCSRVLLSQGVRETLRLDYCQDKIALTCWPVNIAASISA